MTGAAADGLTPLALKTGAQYWAPFDVYRVHLGGEIVASAEYGEVHGKQTDDFGFSSDDSEGVSGPKYSRAGPSSSMKVASEGE